MLGSGLVFSGCLLESFSTVVLVAGARPLLVKIFAALDSSPACTNLIVACLFCIWIDIRMDLTFDHERSLKLLQFFQLEIEEQLMDFLDGFGS